MEWMGKISGDTSGTLAFFQVKERQISGINDSIRMRFPPLESQVTCEKYGRQKRFGDARLLLG